MASSYLQKWPSEVCLHRWCQTSGLKLFSSKHLCAVGWVAALVSQYWLKYNIYFFVCFCFGFIKKQEIKTMSSVVASKIWNCKVFEVQFLFWCTFPPWERYLGTAHYVGSRVSLPASWLYQESCKSFTTAVRLELRLWCISHSPELKCWETFRLMCRLHNCKMSSCVKNFLKSIGFHILSKMAALPVSH